MATSVGYGTQNRRSRYGNTNDETDNEAVKRRLRKMKTSPRTVNRAGKEAQQDIDDIMDTSNVSPEQQAIRRKKRLGY